MNIFANFDVLYYLSHPRNKYRDQTLLEINTMMYLAELLSIYDGQKASKWGYGFSRNKYGAPISAEIMSEMHLLCSKGIVNEDEKGYYHIVNSAEMGYVNALAASSMMGWRTTYIDTVLDSLLTKPFPKVVSAVHNEPGISLLNSVGRTSSLLDGNMINDLYDDFRALKEVINNSQVGLIVPASLWIDYLSVQ